MRLPWYDQRPPPFRTDDRFPAIHSSLTEPEADALQALAKNKRVIEVGSAYGFSTVTMALVAKHVTTIDPHVTHSSLAELQSNLARYDVASRVTIVVGDSKKAMHDYADGSFDMAFIDGDHTYKGVTHDLAAAWNLVREGGVIAVHDYGEETCPEVAPAIDQLNVFALNDPRLIDTLFITRR